MSGWRRCFGWTAPSRPSRLVDGARRALLLQGPTRKASGKSLPPPESPDSPYCPVREALDWLVVAAIALGPIFLRVNRADTVGDSRLTAQSVALVIKALAATVKLDSARYAGHTLRSGFLTSAAHNRARIFKMAEIPAPFARCTSRVHPKRGAHIIMQRKACCSPNRGHDQGRDELDGGGTSSPLD